MNENPLSVSEPSHNTVIYRCPTCQEVVAVVPPEFAIEPEKLEKKRLAHNEKHQLIIEKLKELGS